MPISRPGSARTRRLVPVLAASLCAFVGPLLGGCTHNAATGESRLAIGYLSTSQQIALGDEAQPQLTQEYGGVVPAPAINSYVTEVGMKMVPFTEADNPSLPWEFTLLDSPVINAFALPGGKVFMSRGLAEKMTNEAQLAGVLGHEIGHVTAEHVPERMQTAMGTSLLATVASAAAGLGDSAAIQQLTDVVVGYGGQGYLLSFGRGQELEADMLGMRYMTRAGYDPVGQRQVMAILAEASSGARSPEFLSTHPHPESRIAQINELLATDYAGITGTSRVGLYESRYRQKFLTPIASVPAPTASAEGERRGVVAYAWCGICNPAAPAVE
jgi:predicted Zn-dependent protease